MKYKDDDFKFIYCPECGGNIRLGGIFTSMGMVITGKNGECMDCDKQWHVMWENYEDFIDEDENDDYEDNE